MKLDQQIGKLVPLLERELSFFEKGQKFFSVREIMANFKANRRVVDAALKHLEARGKVRSEYRVGIFCDATDGVRRKKILYAAPDWPSVVNGEWGKTLAEKAARSGDVFRHVNYDFSRLIAPQLPKGGYDVLLLRPPAGDVSPALLREILECEQPVIFCGISLGALGANYVCGDDGFAAAHACLQLHQLNHREVLMLQSEPLGESVRQRIAAFLEMGRLLGMRCRLLDCHTRSGDSSLRNTHETLGKYLGDHGGRIDATALFIPSCECVPPAVSVLGEAGIDVPGDVGVVSISTSSYGEYFQPPLTAVGISVEEEIDAVYEGIDHLSRDPSTPFQRKILPRFIRRGSILDRHSMKGRKRHGK